jgi:hypothetical protein
MTILNAREVRNLKSELAAAAARGDTARAAQLQSKLDRSRANAKRKRIAKRAIMSQS